MSRALRSSDSLKSPGFPNGIRPQLSAKVIFDRGTDRIRGFANGPFGGDQRSCRPTAANPPAALMPTLPKVDNGSDSAPGPFVISARDAVNVATLVSFVKKAFDHGRVEAVLSLLTEGVAVSDVTTRPAKSSRSRAA